MVFYEVRHGRGMPHGELMEFGRILAEVFGQEA